MRRIWLLLLSLLAARQNLCLYLDSNLLRAAGFHPCLVQGNHLICCNSDCSRVIILARCRGYLFSQFIVVDFRTDSEEMCGYLNPARLRPAMVPLKSACNRSSTESFCFLRYVNSNLWRSKASRAHYQTLYCRQFYSAT